MKKFELTAECITFLGRKLFHIKALVAFGNVEAGELGGYIEKEENLDQGGNAWVCGDAKVYGNAWVYGNAEVYGNAKVCGDAEVYGGAKVCGDAEVYGNAKVCGDAEVYGDAKVYGNTKVYGNAEVYGGAKVCGDAEVYGNAKVCGDAEVYERTHILWITAEFATCFRTTTVFRVKGGGINISCGCFLGDLAAFRKQVSDTRNGKMEQNYLKLADLIEFYFDQKGGVDND